MGLQLPWSGRLRASWRQGNAALKLAFASRNDAETPAKSPETLRIGDAEVDLGANRVRAPDGTATTLRRQSALVLRALVARRGHNVSKDVLFREVWPNVAVTDDSLVQCVRDIRLALGSARDALVTVARDGYRLEAEAEPVPPPSPSSGPRFSWLVVVGALLLATAVAGAGAFRSTQTGAELPSIAVLPFEDLAGEARWERLGRGLAAEIGADLVRNKGVVVIPPETVLAMTGEIGAVAEALGVRFVMYGTIQADGDELRVTARLTDAEAGEVIWSDRWARPAEDIFAVQNEIVERIGGSVDGALPNVIARTIRAEAKGRPFHSLDAYELFLLGHELMSTYTPEGFRESIAYFRRALELDPNSVAAMVFLSIAVINWSDHVDDEAEASALVAESFELAERGVEIDPDDPHALIRLCTVRVLQGRRSEAWPLVAHAIELAPLDPGFLADAAWCYPFADQGRAPLDWAKRAIELNPAHAEWYNVGLAMSALFAGDLDLARRAARLAPPMSDTLVTLAAAEALSGNIDEARVWFDRFAAETRYRSLSSYMFVEDLGADPAWGPWVEGARLAGFPVTEAEADALVGR